MGYWFWTIFFGAIAWTLYKKKDLFSPPRLYIIFFAFYLGVNAFNLSRLQGPWSLTTSLYFWGANALFLAGCAIVFLLDTIKHARPADMNDVRLKLREDAASIDWQWLYSIALFCAAVFFLTYGYGYFKTGLIPLFARHPERARLEFLSSLVTGIGWFFGPMSLMLFAECFLFGTLSGRLRTFIVIMSIVTVATYLTLITRLDLFRFFIFVIIIVHYGVKNLSFKHIAIISMAGMLVYLAFSLVRLQTNTMDVMVEIAGMKVARQYLWAANAYSYIANNFWNMDNAFRRYVDGIYCYPHSFGFELFRPLFFFTHLENTLQTSYGFDSIFNESILKLKGLNTVCYMWHFYKDFGSIGVFGLTFLFGILAYIFYSNTMRLPSLFRICIYTVFAGWIIFSVQGPLWSFWYTYFNIGVFAIAHKRIRL